MIEVLKFIFFLVFVCLFAWGAANILASNADWLKDIDDPTLGENDKTKHHDTKNDY